jgi:hypothetical protein
MKMIFTALICAAAAAVAVPAKASDAAWGYITFPYGTSNGAVMFNTDGVRGTPPACSGPGLGARFAINASTLVGQSQLSVLMTAYSLRKRISIHGTGTCSIWGDTETVDYFVVEN